MNPKAFVELFHLLFIEQLSQKLDKRLYALKGGCNLRFFLGSIRYSEDIDIDVQTIAQSTLVKAVNKILSGINFEKVLKTRNISLIDFSMPKQTTTTQRCKIQLKTPIQSLPINTKIEFSRRSSNIKSLSETISPELIMTYNLRPIFFSHYDANVAFQQKIKALILRNETQARDIFDIYHLIQTCHIKIENLCTKEESLLAIDNTMSVSFSDFKSQVLSFLEPNYQSQYDDANIWDTIVATVCKSIGKNEI